MAQIDLGYTPPIRRPAGWHGRAARWVGFVAALAALFLVVVVVGSLGRAGAAPYGGSDTSIALLNPAPCQSSAGTRAVGAGFAAGERIDISTDGRRVGSVLADSHGGFSYMIAVAHTSSGSHTALAKGRRSHTAASTVFQVLITGCASEGAATLPAGTKTSANVANRAEQLSDRHRSISTLDIAAALFLLASIAVAAVGLAGPRRQTGTTT